jgi:hypothetical protein
MNFMEGLSWLFGATPKPELVEGVTIDPDEDLYRPITGSKRDLSAIDADRARTISLYLWRRNGMAHRLIEMLVDFLVGDGLTFTCPDRRAQAIIDKWWTHPGMRLAERHRDLVRDLHLFGELALTVAVNPRSGRMRLGVIDVERIVDVLPDPDDVLTDLALLVRREGSAETYSIELIRYDELTDPAHPGWVGNAFYFGINRVVGQHRGTPTLLALADYIDGWDHLVFDAAERASMLHSFVYDVTLKGANEAVIAEWVHRNGAAPRPGSVRAHNETETWEVKTPNLAASDTVELARMVKNAALGSFGAPEAWFAEGDSANRATLAAQGDPTFQMLRRQQQDVKAMFGLLARYALYQASVAGRLPASADLTVNVQAPELSTKDTSQLASALTQATNALVAAQGQHYIDEKSARRVFLMLAGQLGLKLDEADVEETIEQARAETEPADAIEQTMMRAAGLSAPAAPPRRRSVSLV